MIGWWRTVKEIFKSRKNHYIRFKQWPGLPFWFPLVVNFAFGWKPFLSSFGLTHIKTKFSLKTEFVVTTPKRRLDISGASSGGSAACGITNIYKLDADYGEAEMWCKDGQRINMESWGIVSLESCPAGTQQCSGKFSYIYLPVSEIKIDLDFNGNICSLSLLYLMWTFCLRYIIYLEFLFRNK